MAGDPQSDAEGKDEVEADDDDVEAMQMETRPMALRSSRTSVKGEK
jgi:hypothetical protein